ncbi:MAG: hypothetical protein QM644_06495 [Mobilitalea sp.]
MKSDSEFLNGVYKKAEELKAELEQQIPEEDNGITPLASAFNRKRKQKYSTRYTKYAGMAAGFILLISSTIYVVKLQGNNAPIDLPNPHGVKIINYSGQTLEQATDIVEINVKENNGELQQDIGKVYKNSGNETVIAEFFHGNNIGLIAGDSAIAFLQADTNGAVLMEVFIKAEDNTYVSPFGEVVTEEELNELSK